MAMNFFQHQHRARKRTLFLVVNFVLAVVLIVLAVNAVAWFAFASTVTPPPTLDTWLAGPAWIWITLGTLLVILAGTFHTTMKLRGGGRAVAEMVGARRIPGTTTDPDERRLLNLVEEMSIASGTPVPLVYVMDTEPGINAFVAGLRPTEAVLVVTRGALESFDRDEMQGVIGHEYSHIFNGDMRLNLRLMGILAGILLIGQIGRVMMRSAGRSRGKDSAGIAGIGLALFAIGYIGLFFGALIKAAISRQREFLADASAVQFTRNPDGIAGALYKIRQHASGSHLSGSHSDDISHLCFGEAVSAGFTSLMATHPPLDDRINAINPRYMALQAQESVKRRARAESGAPPAGVAAVPGAASGFAGGAIHVTPGEVTESIGEVKPEHLAYAESLHADFPRDLLWAVRGTAGARLAVYAMVLAGMAEADRTGAMAMLASREGDEVSADIRARTAEVDALGARTRLPLLNLALPSLKAMDGHARRGFLETLERLIRSDNRYTVLEYALLVILQQHLAADAEKEMPVRYFRYEPVMDDIRLLLTVLSRVGAHEEKDIEESFRHGMSQFAPDPGTPVKRNECSLPALNRSLDRLEQLTPLLKAPVIQACADVVIRDGQVTAGEGELLQAVALLLDCPMPPLLETAKP